MDENEYCTDPICLNCGSKNLFRDDHSDDLICGECNTQSQSLSQRETTEQDNMNAATKKLSGPRRKSNVVVIEEDKIEEDFRIPSLTECIEAFLSLVEQAATRSVSKDLMPNLDHIQGFAHWKQNVIEGAREICLLFLERWDESANHFMIKFPFVRISLKDGFLTDNLRNILTLQISKTIEGKFDVENSTGTKTKIESESDNDSENENEDQDYDSDIDLARILSKSEKRGKAVAAAALSPTTESSQKQVRWHDSQDTFLYDDSQDLSVSTPIKTRIQDSPSSRSRDQAEASSSGRNNIKSWQSLKKAIEKSWVKTFKDDTLYWKVAILDMSPDLNLITSIVYLAHLCAHTGIASNHFVIWAQLGKYPYLLDAYGQFDSKHQENLKSVKSKWLQSRHNIPSPEKIDRVATVLLTCLVDPNDEKENLLSDLYRLSANLMDNKEFLEGNYLRKLITARKEAERKSTKNDNVSTRNNVSTRTRNKILVKDIQLEDGSQQSPIRAIQLGQYSQESQDSIEMISDVPESYYNVGLMCNMFCAHLGVNNQVIRFAYALMSIPIPICQENYESGGELEQTKDQEKCVAWLPAALELANPTRLVSTAHVVAVIVVACKFCPGWEQWNVQLSKQNNQRNEEIGSALFTSQDSADDESYSSDQVRIKKRKFGTDTSEAIRPPFYDSKGNNAFDYLDFMPKNEDEARFTSDDFKASLSGFPVTKKNSLKRSERVSGSTNLSGEMDLKNRGNCCTTRNLSNENGLCEYLAYKRSGIEFSSGVHTAYFTLLTYIADSLFVDRKKLHYLVTCFDEEIIKYAETARKSDP